ASRADGVGHGVHPAIEGFGKHLFGVEFTLLRFLAQRVLEFELSGLALAFLPAHTTGVRLAPLMLLFLAPGDGAQVRVRSADGRVASDEEPSPEYLDRRAQGSARDLGEVAPQRGHRDAAELKAVAHMLEEIVLRLSFERRAPQVAEPEVDVSVGAQ